MFEGARSLSDSFISELETAKFSAFFWPIVQFM
jgi:hypothetical protein